MPNFFLKIPNSSAHPLKFFSYVIFMALIVSYASNQLETVIVSKEAQVEYVLIPVPSRRQAMDWSLVLASQGISAHIHKSDVEEDGFGIRVRGGDYPRAVDSIEKYQHENRRWSWRRTLPVSGAPFHWGGMVWCLVLIVFFFMTHEVNPALRSATIFDSEAVRAGQWWRSVTATMLHGDLAHLASNVSAGVVLIGIAMGRYGVGPALLASLLAGVGGNYLGLIMHAEPYRGLGASGVVFGALGLMGPHAIGLLRESWRAVRVIVSAILAVSMLFVLFGFSPESDIFAHIGGFLAGLVLGCVLGLIPEKILFGFKATLISAVGVGAIVTYTWWRAIESYSG